LNTLSMFNILTILTAPETQITEWSIKLRNKNSWSNFMKNYKRKLISNDNTPFHKLFYDFYWISGRLNNRRLDNEWAHNCTHSTTRKRPTTKLEIRHQHQLRIDEIGFHSDQRPFWTILSCNFPIVICSLVHLKTEMISDKFKKKYSMNARIRHRTS